MKTKTEIETTTTLTDADLSSTNPFRRKLAEAGITKVSFETSGAGRVAMVLDKAVQRLNEDLRDVGLPSVRLDANGEIAPATAPTERLRLVVDRDELAAALHAAIQIAEKKSITASGHVLLRSTPATENHPAGMEMVATDLTTTLLRRLPAEIEQAGALVLLAKPLREIVRRLPRGNLLLERSAQDNYFATLTDADGTFGYTLPGLDPAEYPTLDPALLGRLLDHAIELDRPDLQLTVQRVAASVSEDDCRPNLCGIHLQTTPDQRLQLQTTDGHRFSRATTVEAKQWHLRHRETLDLLVPAKALTAIAEVFPAHEPTLWLGADESRLAVIGSQTTIVTQRLEGDFPDVSKIVDGPDLPRATLPVGDLRAALDRLVQVGDGKTGPCVGLQVIYDGVHGYRLRLETGSVDLGRGWAELELPDAHRAYRTWANGKYLLELLDACLAGKLVLSGGDELSPLRWELVRPEGQPPTTDLLWLIMPMRDPSAPAVPEDPAVVAEREQRLAQAKEQQRQRRAAKEIQVASQLLKMMARSTPDEVIQHVQLALAGMTEGRPEHTIEVFATAERAGLNRPEVLERLAELGRPVEQR